MGHQIGSTIISHTSPCNMSERSNWGLHSAPDPTQHQVAGRDPLQPDLKHSLVAVAVQVACSILMHCGQWHSSDDYK